MYVVDSKDHPRQLTGMPQSSVGAPCPMVVAGEHSLHLAYYLQNRPSDWNGDSIRLVSDHDADETCAVVSFTWPYAHMFGPPNDEAFDGHPLASRGLQPYAVFEVDRSSWLRGLERMNSVHPYHEAKRFEVYRHYIFAFHDTTFECIARSFELSVARGSVRSVLLRAVEGR